VRLDRHFLLGEDSRVDAACIGMAGVAGDGKRQGNVGLGNTFCAGSSGPGYAEGRGLIIGRVQSVAVGSRQIEDQLPGASGPFAIFKPCRSEAAFLIEGHERCVVPLGQEIGGLRDAVDGGLDGVGDVAVGLLVERTKGYPMQIAKNLLDTKLVFDLHCRRIGRMLPEQDEGVVCRLFGSFGRDGRRC
jgi:hypothetical protein